MDAANYPLTPMPEHFLRAFTARAGAALGVPHAVEFGRTRPQGVRAAGFTVAEARPKPRRAPCLQEITTTGRTR